MTPVLPRDLADHVLIARMAKALRKMSDTKLSIFLWRECLYWFHKIPADEIRRLDAFALTAELRRREVVQSKRRDAA